MKFPKNTRFLREIDRQKRPNSVVPRFDLYYLSDSNPNLKIGFGYPNLRFESGRPTNKQILQHPE